ncbi:hypothetical protein K438DRAFT_1999296 [Mycena galopus ATCC 62051]|nr:hypothetical protein K438DRAFT_1999296 [Mycena galopus ATCC 62051]
MPSATTGEQTGNINIDIELIPKDLLGISLNSEDGRHDEWYLSARGILTRNKHHLCALREQEELDVNDPIYYGRQFRDTVRYLPLCSSLRDSFQRNQRNHGDAFEAWKRLGQGMTVIHLTADYEHALTCVIVGFTISTMAHAAQEHQGVQTKRLLTAFRVESAVLPCSCPHVLTVALPRPLSFTRPRLSDEKVYIYRYIAQRFMSSCLDSNHNLMKRI